MHLILRTFSELYNLCFHEGDKLGVVKKNYNEKTKPYTILCNIL